MKKKETMRRFQGSEILLHWGNAVLYLTLFCSGSLLLLERLSGHAWLPSGVLTRVHRIAGILLVALLAQMLLLSALAESCRCFWRTLLQCLAWRGREVVWLLKVPLNAITKRVVLPPADRFNAGQKLHLLVIVVVLLGFSVSGLAMILIPGALAPWIIHVACFVPAAAFLLLHLFLSLVNPETRKSLPSIFSGKVTLEYARQHHGLWLGQTDSEHRASYVSLPMVLAALLLVVGAAAACTVTYGPAKALDVMRATIVQQGTNAVCPGPLVHGHADGIADAKHCAQCHSLFASPSSEKCLECHDEIQARMATQSGYHGTLSGPCRQCHGEHRAQDASLIDLVPETFNHSQANFRLEGKHQDVSCEACHTAETSANRNGGMRYIGLEHGRCVSCHADPHGDERNQDCLRCHSLENWGRAALTFDHARDSQFVLEGEHAQLPCEKCHRREVAGTDVRVHLFDIGKSCHDCHVDPHQGQFAQNCDQCHTEQGWKNQRGASFHGPDSSFPLVGRHVRLQCDQCHEIPATGSRLADARFRGTGRECGSCHSDPHAGQMRSTCRTCHVETGWRGEDVKFAHNRHASFRLDALHSTLACHSCHGQQEKRYRPLPSECGACHKLQELAMKGRFGTRRGAPDPHDGRLSCTDCHDVSKPTQRLSEFADRCASCHNAHYGKLFYAWSENLAKNRTLAQHALDTTEALPDEQKLELEKRIQEAHQVGFHNLKLAQQLSRGLADMRGEDKGTE